MAQKTCIRCGDTLAAIGKRHSVTDVTILAAIRGKAWQHVQ